MAIPLVALVIPLVKLAPPVYRWRIRIKIANRYRLLMNIDEQIASGTILDTLDENIAQLVAYEDELAKISVPVMYAADYYSMRSHVRYLRGRLEEIKIRHPSYRDQKWARVEIWFGALSVSNGTEFQGNIDFPLIQLPL